MLLPPDYRPAKGATEKELIRSVIDYIAGMMDKYAFERYDEYFAGSNPIL